MQQSRFFYPQAMAPTQTHQVQSANTVTPNMAGMVPVQMMVPEAQAKLMQKSYQQQPMQMQPMQMQPMQMQPQAVQPIVKTVDAPADQVTLEFGEDGARHFLAHGIQDPHQLRLKSDNLSYQITKLTAEDKRNKGHTYQVEFNPGTNNLTHEVAMTYKGQPVRDTPFQLAPMGMKPTVSRIEQAPVEKMQPMKALASTTPMQEVEVQMHDTDKHHLVASNVHDVDKFHLDTSMAYQMFADPADEKTFHVLYKPQGKTHHLDLHYDGKPVNKGQFQFIPKNTTNKVREQTVESLIDPMNNLKLNQAPQQVAPETTEAELEHRRRERQAKLAAMAEREAKIAAMTERYEQREAEQRVKYAQPAVEQPKMQATPDSRLGEMVMQSKPQVAQAKYTQDRVAQPVMQAAAARENLGQMVMASSQPAMQQTGPPMYYMGTNANGQHVPMMMPTMQQQQQAGMPTMQPMMVPQQQPMATANQQPMMRPQYMQMPGMYMPVQQQQ